MVSHGNLLSNCKYIQQAFQLSCSSISCSWLPFFHDMGLVDGVLQVLYTGYTAHLMAPSSFLQSPMFWLEAISKYRVSHSGGPNFSYDLCTEKVKEEEKQRLDLSCWRSAYNGAEPVRKETLELFASKFKDSGFKKEYFYPCYGMAEITLMASGSKLEEVPIYYEVSSEQLLKNKAEAADKRGKESQTLVGCGKAILDTRIIAVNHETLKKCKQGEIGEIWISGSSVAEGYWKRLLATKEMFHAYLKDQGEGPFLRTGDLGFLREDGELFITGRLKDVIIVRGKNHYPQDIEKTVEKAVNEVKPNACAAFSIETELKESLVVVAEIKREYRRRSDIEKVARAIGEAISQHHELEVEHVLVIKPFSMPKTSSGKIQRQLCKQKFIENNFNALGKWSRREKRTVSMKNKAEYFTSILEKVLAKCWSDILKISILDLNSDSNFFGLGGDSLKALQLSQRISQEFNAELDDSFVYQFFNIRNQAEYLEKNKIYPQTLSAIDISFSLPEIREKASSIQSNLKADFKNRFKPFSLTDMQTAYWLGRTDAFELGNISCYFYAEFESEDIDINRLEKAWQKLIERHEMLRVVINKDGKQQILAVADTKYKFKINDLSKESKVDLERKLEDKRRYLSHKVQIADKWPLFDITITKLPKIKTIHFGIDLLIVDAKSIFSLFKEWHFYYKNINKPNKSLPDLEVSFRDYVLALREFEESDIYKSSLEYWQKELVNIYPAPILPTAKSAAFIKKPQFYRKQFKIDRCLNNKLTELSKSYGLTKTGLVLTVFALILSKWSKDPCFTINVTLFSRLNMHPQINDILGDFTTNCLLSVDLKNKRTLIDHIKDVQNRLWQHLDNRHVSGVKVLRMLSKETGISSMPIVFTSALGLNEGKESVFKWLGKNNFTVSQTPQVWLDHQVYEEAGELFLSWDVVAGLFPDKMIEDMFASYQLSLEEALKSNLIIEFNLPKRQVELRAKANNTKEDVSDEFLHTLFFRKAMEQPRQKAVISSKRTLSYSELANMVLDIAEYLCNMKCQVNELIGVFMHKGWEQAVATLGIMTSGSAYLPIDPDLPRERVLYLLENGDVKTVLTQSKLDREFEWPENIRRITVDDYKYNKNQGYNIKSLALEPKQKKTDLAYVIFTSGSTGQPKGVMIDHQGAVNTILDINKKFNVTKEDKIFGVSCLNFDLSVYDLFGTFAAGATLVFPDGCQIRNPEHLALWVSKEKITVWNTVPALMEMLLMYVLEKPRLYPASLRLVMLSGDWIPVSLLDQLRKVNKKASLISLGGATEGSIWSIYYPVNNVGKDWRSIPYGKPLSNQTFHVLNHVLEDCPEWVKGELYIGGLGVAKGYWRDKEKTKRHYLVHPRTNERLYRTGDWGRYLPDGNIEFLGREDTQVKIKGHRIECGEIEVALLKYHDIKSAVVLPFFSSKTKVQSLIAYVVRNKESYDFELANVPSNDIIIDKIKRLEFRKAHPGIRTFEQIYQSNFIDLEDSIDIDGLVCKRNTVRFYKKDRILFSSFSRFMGLLRQLQVKNQPKYLYPSAGALYPVQTYVYVKKDRIEGLKEGIYYYHPIKHRLIFISRNNISHKVHYVYNQLYFDSSAFSIFLIGNLDAIKPLYGNQSKNYCLLEAGYIGQLLMREALEYNIGLCAIGDLDFKSIQHIFRLNDSSFLCHSFVGGIPDSSYEESHLISFSEQIKKYLQAKLPESMIPGFYIELENLPLTPNGKIDYRKLPKLVLDQKDNYIPPKTKTEKQICYVWEDVLGCSKVGISDNFFNLGGDSLKAVDVTLKMINILKKELPLDLLIQYPTISDILNLIANKSIKNEKIDLESEAILEDGIQPLKGYIPFVPSAIFITGTTGFLGAFLLYELLNSTDVIVFCLVRAKTKYDGFEKVKNNLIKYQLWREVFSSRIRIILGDLAKIRFGMTKVDFEHLSTQFDFVFHCGAKVDFVSDYKGLKGANVNGTKEVLRLCCCKRPKKLHFISSIAVFDSFDFESNTLIEERELGCGNNVFGGYAQSKWVAECLVNEARQRGLDVHIYRPGIIFGDTKHGYINNKDLINKMIKGCVELKIYPDLKISLDFVPVDFVGKFIVRNSLKENKEIYHYNLVNPSKISLETFMKNLIGKMGYKLDKVSFELWCSIVKKSKNPVLYPFLPYFTNKVFNGETILERYVMNVRPTFDNKLTMKIADNLKIVCSKIEVKWISLCLNKLME